MGARTVDVYSGKGGWGSGEIETHSRMVLAKQRRLVERVDGAQARLKHTDSIFTQHALGCGKGGWGSGEIETRDRLLLSLQLLRGKGGWGSGEIETPDCAMISASFTVWEG